MRSETCFFLSLFAPNPTPHLPISYYSEGVGVGGWRPKRRERRPPRIVHHPSDVVVKVGNPATLSCRADGSPKPTIEWLRNNQPLETAKRDGQLQPMILSDGSLFFLSVEGGRQGQSHEGVYTCVARNSAGKDTSRNASLFIAVYFIKPSMFV
uniref:Ig-like domain-containing protein n=1 Tax=Neolamprologus brichardi TaxID=32507 RepID=A0A3Q4GAR6_NEOBR